MLVEGASGNRYCFHGEQNVLERNHLLHRITYQLSEMALQLIPLSVVILNYL